ncbi:zinc chelation protein SecC [Photobacterium jeanii]|uniref:Zinc chelation protein SecC n=1 Tax=Photobacterium jeanii TaxID=858640 RepID=A0A178K2Q7_9GAMM|nr:PBPRA1643 family SWIM/SEC-C metal-binding motif protein [Photobacterium jeanii]OAN11561.1 zinc chelation protein SecC [Photobacterium jeanii]PST91083.1 zinc chelation protein SecC [Photobacterium jeanii]
MSKFFYKGRIEKKPKHESYGYNTKRSKKLGTEELPLTLSVQSQDREEEIKALVAEHGFFADITINADLAENITELEGLINKPKTTTFEKTPNRNDPCSCGSGKKFKKCCA